MLYAFFWVIPRRLNFIFYILTYLVPVLFTVYVRGVLKLKKNNSGAKKLIPITQVPKSWASHATVI